MANKHWYAKKNGLSNEAPSMKRVDCPVCRGTGKRMDAKTGDERGCVACDGVGVVKLLR